MQPRIAFLVMSAVSRPQTVDQLARSLVPHTVLVHHDFSQSPDFPLTSPNVRFVPEPRRTGWAHFGFIEGIFHSLQYALSHLAFDYLQLLSPTCLPLKPMARFEAHVAEGQLAHFDGIDLLADRDALMNVGYRAFTPEGSWRHRLARRASDIYFGGSTARRDEAGIWLRSGGGRGVVSRAMGGVIQTLSRPSIGRHPFGSGLHPYYGSAWFGARREVVAGMVEFFDRPGVRDYFSRLRIAEEFLLPTMLAELAPVHGPLNHAVKRFEGAHAGWYTEADLESLRGTHAFFGRKFPDDPAAPVRVRVLRELAGISTPWGARPRVPARIPAAAHEAVHDAAGQPGDFAPSGGLLRP
ncbi:hypothetical protein [Ramlibacter humi]|uniref:Glycosyl transferase n=1 Tax=Ramlibacter humi TaxID=2530451 RepID=A0A4Z0C8Q7_9BURK|nr:hypothetical protein [Ramlibacter humi]TFZ08067.1 hypothetical protein EZ216_02565 [Ramlibacter humi]